MITDEAKTVKAAAYAEHISDLVKRKHTLEEEIEHQRDELDLSGVAIGERVSISPSMDAIPDGVAHLIELINRYATDLAEYVDEIDCFCVAIARLTPRQQSVLYLRYVMLRKWPEVARRLRYSESRIYDTRRDALIALYDAMPEYWRSTVIPKAQERSE